jgi:hypothetical protein
LAMSKRSPFFHLFLDQTVMQSCSSAKFIGQLGNDIWYNVQHPFGALLGKDFFGGIAHFAITVLC